MFFVAEAMTDQTIAHDTTIELNVVDRNTWGRGISVIGGKRITIGRNYINGTSAAGLIMASESYWQTYGVSLT